MSKKNNFFFFLAPWPHSLLTSMTHDDVSLSFTVSGTADPWCRLTSQSQFVRNISLHYSVSCPRSCDCLCCNWLCTCHILCSAAVWTASQYFIVLALSVGCNVPFN
jgi:hypothetical protein